jgi:Transposase
MKVHSTNQTGDCLLSSADVKGLLQKSVDAAAAYCEAASPKDAGFLQFEKSIAAYVMTIGRLLIQLYLVSRHAHLDLEPYLKDGKYRVADPSADRTLKTVYGPVSYVRAYLFPREKGKGVGFHPLDMILGLTRDALSPYVIQFVSALATRMSFGATRLVCKMAINWTPSQETIENCVLGMGRRASAFVTQMDASCDDGDVLIIQIDGKCAPTATEEELEKRRGQRRQHVQGCTCGCKRHKNEKRRKSRGSRKRRKRGDKSKNGKEITMIVMFTLKKGEDGKLHGPHNIKKWATFAGRQAGMMWARAEATKRGFGDESGKTVQILMDGAKSLRTLASKYFPKAILTIDVYHVVEKLWDLGRKYCKEGGKELKAFVEELKELLYAGKVTKLLKHLVELLKKEPKTGPGTKARRTKLRKLIGYIKTRKEMMRYGEFRKADLLIATGQVEGAVRHVVGQRLDCAGMRWVPGKAEALLHLRCIMINGDWEAFANWHDEECRKKLAERGAERVLTDQPIPLPSKKPRKKKAA